MSKNIPVWYPDMVIYHANCFDGMAAAWAIHETMGAKAHRDIEFVAADYGQAPPDVTGKNVMMVDFSYKKPVLLAMGEQAKTILILDHHESAKKELQNFRSFDNLFGNHVRFWEHLDRDSTNLSEQNIFAHFDMNKAGSLLAWEFSNPFGKPPELISLINDRDLWEFALDDSKAFGIWLGSQELSIPNFYQIHLKLIGPQRHDVMREAHAMKKLFDENVKNIAADVEMRTIAGYIVPSVSCPLIYRSEVGHYLNDQYPDAKFSATFHDTKGNRKWSLRCDDPQFDVSEIAEQFGGGGHPGASGFNVKTTNDFD